MRSWRRPRPRDRKRGIAIARPVPRPTRKQSRGSGHDATTGVIEMSPKQRREPSRPERKSTRAGRTCGLPLGPGAGRLRQSPSSPSRRNGSVDRVVLLVRSGSEAHHDRVAGEAAELVLAYRRAFGNQAARTWTAARWRSETAGASVARSSGFRPEHKRPSPAPRLMLSQEWSTTPSGPLVCQSPSNDG